MSLDAQIITLVVDDPDRFVDFQRMGITSEDFAGDHAQVWEFLGRMKKSHGSIPSRSVVKNRFSFLMWSKVAERDIPVLVSDLRARRRYNDCLQLLIDSARELQEPEDLETVLPSLMGGLNALSMRNGENPLIDILSATGRRAMLREIKERRIGNYESISTGLPTLDNIIGGLQKQRMVTVIGRTGSGKSWIDLFFVAEAIMQGKKVLLYPLEMSVFETMMRLYTIFSQKMFAGRRTFRNLDLSKGRVNRRSLLKFLSILEEKYSGQLLISDISKLSSPYTIERIEAEVEINAPDMFWIDYLTLLKPPAGFTGAEDWNAVRAMSNGVKGIAMRYNVIGGTSAQVNREAIKSRAFLPRLEHIAFGDSIGHDADQVVSLAKRGSVLSYSLVKNRLGPEVGRVDAKFNVNLGSIEEIQAEVEEEDGDS